MIFFFFTPEVRTAREWCHFPSALLIPDQQGRRSRVLSPMEPHERIVCRVHLRSRKNHVLCGKCNKIYKNRIVIVTTWLNFVLQRVQYSMHRTNFISVSVNFSHPAEARKYRTTVQYPFFPGSRNALVSVSVVSFRPEPEGQWRNPSWS